VCFRGHGNEQSSIIKGGILSEWLSKPLVSQEQISSLEWVSVFKKKTKNECRGVVPRLRWLIAGCPPWLSRFDPSSGNLGFMVGKKWHVCGAYPFHKLPSRIYRLGTDSFVKSWSNQHRENKGDYMNRSPLATDPEVPSSIPGPTRFSEKSGMGSTQPLRTIEGATWMKK
jgi:hypothetical protein